MDAEIFVPFIFFSFLTAIIVVPAMAKEKTKRSAHQLISQAIARGQDLDPSTISRMTEDMLDNYGGGRARRSFGNAVVLLALAGGFLGAGAVLSNLDHDGDVLYGMAVPAVILGSVGAAFLILSVVDFFANRRAAA